MTPRTRVPCSMLQAGARSWDKILSRRNGQAPTPRRQSTEEQCQLDSAAVHTGVPKDEMRNMLVSGWAPAGRAPWSRRRKAEWSLNAGEGSSGAAGV